jgi:CRP-like cAMP-binding protein
MHLELFFAPLLQAPLFAGLGPQQLKTLALGCERCTFDPGDVVIMQDRPGDAAYLIVEGAVARIDHPLGAVGREEFGPGTLVGEMAMLIETEHTSTMVAQGPVTALRLSRAVIGQMCETDAELANYFAGRMQERVDDMITGLNQIAALLREETDEPRAGRLH